MKTKKAETVNVGKCPHCDRVHIYLWRGGKAFAEIILDPDVAAAFAADVAEVAAGAPTPEGGHVH